LQELLRDTEALKRKIEVALSALGAAASGPETIALHARAKAAEASTPRVSHQTNPPTPSEPLEALLLGEGDGDKMVSSPVPARRVSVLSDMFSFPDTEQPSVITESTSYPKDLLLTEEKTPEIRTDAGTRARASDKAPKQEQRASWKMRKADKNMVRVLQDDKGNTIYSPMFAAHLPDFNQRFKKLWDANPHQIDKKRAELACAKLSPEDFALLEENCPSHFEKWRKMQQIGDGDYIPLFVNFINRDYFRESATPRPRDGRNKPVRYDSYGRDRDREVKLYVPTPEELAHVRRMNADLGDEYDPIEEN